MKNITKALLISAICTTLTSCESIKRFDSRRISPSYLFGKNIYIDSRIDSVPNAPEINIRSFLDGDIEGHGIKTNSRGEVTEVQMIKIKSRWQGNRAQVEFNYHIDGQVSDSRMWLITLNTDGTFDASAHDAIGMIAGKQQGNTAQMIYDLMLPEYEKKIRSHFSNHSKWKLKLAFSILGE